MTWLGELSLWVAVLMTAWGTCVGLAAGVQRRSELAASGARAVVASAAFLTLAVMGLWDALVGVDLSLRYVARHVGANVPIPWRVASAWAGPEGRLLLWAWLISLAGLGLVIAEWRRRSVRAAWTIALSSCFTGIAALLSAAGASPFIRLSFEPPDGGGLAPALREGVFLWQPPLLLAGLALAAPVSALAIAARLSRTGDAALVARLRRLGAGAWAVLGVGLLLGFWWTWVVRGEQRQWLAAALGTPALIVWCVLGAALHALVAGERDSGERPPALRLAALAWPLTLPAAILPSVAPWEGALSLAPRPFTLVVWGTALVASLLVWVALRASRAAATTVGGPRTGLGAGGRLAALRVGAWALLAIGALLAVPLIGAAATGARASGAIASMAVASLLAAAVVPAAVATVLPWRGRARGPWRRLAIPAAVATAAALAVWPGGAAAGPVLALAASAFAITAFALAALRAARVRARDVTAVAELPVADVRRAAGLVAHAGAALLLAGLAGASLSARHEIVLGTGERRSLRDPFGLHWDIVGQGISRYDAESREVLALAVELRQGTAAPRLATSELRQFHDARGLPLGDVVVRSGRTGTLLEEVRVVLLDAPSEDRARLRVTFAPLVLLTWVGGALLVVGGGLSLMPAPRAHRPSGAAVDDGTVDLVPGPAAGRSS